MNSAELLSRLNPHIPGESTGHSFDSLSWSDIAGSLAGLPRPSQLVLLSKYAMYAGCEDEILYYVLNHAVKIWSQNKWGYPREMGPGFLRRLSKLCLIDCLFPLPCKRCKGHKRTLRLGQDKAHAYSIVCPRCEGFGTSNLSDRDRAKILGIPYSTWREHRYRYKCIADTVACWNSSGLEHVKRKLS